MMTRGTLIARLVGSIALGYGSLVALPGTASAAIALPAEELPITDAPLRHDAGIGCKLVGGAVVCGRGEGGLLDRKVLPRKRKETKPVQKKPVQTKPAPKKTSPSKSTSSGGSKSKSSGSKSSGSKTAPAAMPAGAEGEDAETEVRHSCPPGHVVLEKANAAGAYCEPVGAASPGDETPPAPTKKEKPADTNDKPAPPTPKPDEPKGESEPVSEPPLGATALPDEIRAAACGPGVPPNACACPGGSAYESEACKAALPACCAATVSADGKPQPAISRCGADQNKAMSAVVSAAMEKKLTLGPVRCTNR
jgi:hypothetical protein